MRTMWNILACIFFMMQISFGQDTISDEIIERQLNYLPKQFKVCNNHDTLIIKGQDTIKNILFYGATPFTGVQIISLDSGKTAHYWTYKKGMKTLSELYVNGKLVMTTFYKNEKVNGKRISRNSN